MKRTENEKTKLILYWFRKSTSNASDDKKISVLNKWINICSKEEEFKIAEVLKKEQDRIKHDQLIKKINWLCFFRVKLTQAFNNFKSLWIEKKK